jgi:hypothetical protein
VVAGKEQLNFDSEFTREKPALSPEDPRAVAQLRQVRAKGVPVPCRKASPQQSLCVSGGLVCVCARGHVVQEAFQGFTFEPTAAAL